MIGQDALSLIEAVRTSIAPYKTLIIGVSGGADSSALLYAVHEVTNSLPEKLKIIVAHVDHGIREVSHKDSAFVEALASKLSLTFELLQLVPPQNENLENWGRRSRYAFFKTLKEKYQADVIVTAHTASDNEELFLMRLFSNKPFVPMSPYETKRSLLRPLLSLHRRQIEDFCRSRSIAFMSDETNLDNTYLRNRTRNLVIPFLNEQYGDSFPQTLSEQVVIAQENEDLMTFFLNEKFEPLLIHQKYSKKWKNTVESILPKLPLMLQWRFADKLFFDEFSLRLGRDAGTRLAHFFMSNAPQLQLPHGKTIKRVDGAISFEDS